MDNFTVMDIISPLAIVLGIAVYIFSYDFMRDRNVTTEEFNECISRIYFIVIIWIFIFHHGIGLVLLLVYSVDRFFQELARKRSNKLRTFERKNHRH